nr:xanthine dehydrogenase family protein molybdopterin-binding subunit [Bacteroidota bacterium]
MAQIGKPIDRVDAWLKVTGGAKYAAEFNQKNMAYGFPIRSTIGKGTITSFDMDAAMKSKGVIKILTHENAPHLKAIDPEAMKSTGGMLGEQLVPLQDNKIFYFGQYVGVVIAKTYEQA